MDVNPLRLCFLEAVYSVWCCAVWIRVNSCVCSAVRGFYLYFADQQAHKNANLWDVTVLQVCVCARARAFVCMCLQPLLRVFALGAVNEVGRPHQKYLWRTIFQSSKAARSCV